MRWQLSQTLSILTRLESFIATPQQCAVQAPAMAACKSMFGVVFQAFVDWAEAKVYIRKQILKQFDRRFELVN